MKTSKNNLMACLRFTLFFLILFWAKILKAQTILETKDWINGNLAICAYQSTDVSQSYYVEIVENSFIFQNESKNNFNGVTIVLKDKCVINFNDIYSIETDDNEDNIWVTFISKNFFKLYYDDKVESVREYNIILSKKLNENNLKYRFLNAVNHILEIKGIKLPTAKF